MSQSSPAEQPELIRGVGLAGATTLNMIDMIGVGPFITLPLIVAAAGGPQAMLGWILGAVFALCDGLVWAELGAAMPGAEMCIRDRLEVQVKRSPTRALARLLDGPYLGVLAAFVEVSAAADDFAISSDQQRSDAGIGRGERHALAGKFQGLLHELLVARLFSTRHVGYSPAFRETTVSGCLLYTSGEVGVGQQLGGSTLPSAPDFRSR